MKRDTSQLSNLPDKLLFTPGPLTTSRTVKTAMLRDLGSRDVEFIESVRAIRNKLLEVAGVSQQAGYEVVLIQGSGTFGIESVISSAVPPQGKLLVVINGAYGERIAKIAAAHRIATSLLRYEEDALPRPSDVGQALGRDSSITDVAIVHCETTSGIFNPVAEIGRVVKGSGATYIVDSMSAFGAVPLDLAASGVDYLISSANKCIEGVPGFSFAICRREALLRCEGSARTLSLDLLAQWQGLEQDGQFRFTPPTHCILAFAQALAELEQEGGVLGRAARYRANYERLLSGMTDLGFQTYLPLDRQGYIITSFRMPPDSNFVFSEFYSRLNAQGFVIYPGKVSNADCFRIGNIGRIFPENVESLLEAVAQSLSEMGVRLMRVA